MDVDFGDDALYASYTLSANLIWDVLGKVTLGLEYLLGRRENEDAQFGTDNRMLLPSKFIF